MILRRLCLSCLLLPIVVAEWDCILSRDRLHWDLSKLGPKTMSFTVHLPPSSALTEIELDLCKALPTKEGVADIDQCPAGTQVCMRTINMKDAEPDRVTRVTPIAGDISTSPYSSTMKPEFTGGSEDNTKPLYLVLHGPAYPPEPHNPSLPQSVNITFHCSDTEHDPTYTLYDKAVLSIDWTSKAACAQSGGAKPDDDEKDNGGGGGGDDRGRGGSGIGWFFLVLFIAIIAYFGLGAYYNYTQYGASGWDLIPHRDFWRDVPFLVRDITSHLCSTIRPGGGRGGYTAV